MKPRSDVVVRRFLAGESIARVALAVEMPGIWSTHKAYQYVESCIRRALGRKGKR